MHCQYRRGQVDAEGALPLEAVALHGAVGAADEKPPVAAGNSQGQCLHASRVQVSIRVGARGSGGGGLGQRGGEVSSAG